MKLKIVTFPFILGSNKLLHFNCCNMLPAELETDYDTVIIALYHSMYGLEKELFSGCL